MKTLATHWLKYQIPVALGLAIAGSILGGRWLGLFQALELQTFDRMVASRPAEPTDHRIVIVGVSDIDLQALGSNDISDAVMAKLIRRIYAQEPRVIGLDFYRNLPLQPGHAELQTVFRTTPNLIGIQKVISDTAGVPVRGNAVLVESDRVAASDILADPDGRVRRALLVPNTETEKPIFSLGLRVALDYLRRLNIRPADQSPILTLNQLRFPPFQHQDGGYVRADSGGYQILLNLRNSVNGFSTVSMTQVLSGTVPADTFKDKIVLIGSTLPGNSDAFYTAYSNRFGLAAKPMYGVELHAQIASQLLSAVLDDRRGIYVFPEALEAVWIAIAVGLGGWIQLGLANERTKLGLTVGLVGGLLGGSYLLLLAGWWFPVVPVAIALGSTVAVMMSYKSRQLRQLSTRDELTQLANRRTFNEMLEREWYRALRSQTALALIICDVDYFKRYNDTYGHPQGDECLRQVAKALRRSALRSSDLVARYGGEEFVLLLPNTDATGALQVAESARSQLQALHIPHTTSDVAEHVTLSLGLTAIVPNLDIAPSTLLKIADLGLYEAKHNGRNQAIFKSL